MGDEVNERGEHTVTIRTNHDDWTEVHLDTEYGMVGRSALIYMGHEDAPSWLGDLMRQIGVPICVVEVDFEAEAEEFRREMADDGL